MVNESRHSLLCSQNTSYRESLETHLHWRQFLWNIFWYFLFICFWCPPSEAPLFNFPTKILYACLISISERYVTPTVLNHHNNIRQTRSVLKFFTTKIYQVSPNFLLISPSISRAETRLSYNSDANISAGLKTYSGQDKRKYIHNFSDLGCQLDSSCSSATQR
jgi:hypothetical protein